MKTLFFGDAQQYYVVQCMNELSKQDIDRLCWLLSSSYLGTSGVKGVFIGYRKEVVSPWATNAVEIAENVGIAGIKRIEQFISINPEEVPVYDPMLQAVFRGLDENSLLVTESPEPMLFIKDIAAYNLKAGLALSEEEVGYLIALSVKLGRLLTDSEIYGFSQINSEHCRHKIFNGQFIIDGQLKEKTLFELIKYTSQCSPENLVSAYKDNVAFIRGPEIFEFAPESGLTSSYFSVRKINSVLSLKAETHNFPTTVEPFNGASTGSGGEIRDRMAGGIGSIPLAGTAVYMTAYPRLQGSLAASWERWTKERNWKYQSPLQILIKASNGASDFGNKFGQPLICGSVFTYEGRTPFGLLAYDRCIMLAGGVGYASTEHAIKKEVEIGDKVILLGGDNYRIGMAGGSVSSVITGVYDSSVELNAVQRANPEMQKRVYNVIRSLCQRTFNPVKTVHDHGAGGHINCFSELLEKKGGKIYLDSLPIGDATLSYREIICNESQERMGLIVSAKDVPELVEIAQREAAPCYIVGEVTGDEKIIFETKSGERPIALSVSDFFGSTPITQLLDSTPAKEFDDLEYSIEYGSQLLSAIENVLSLEGVACKDWLTNKVDRSVTGLVAVQQCCGRFQLPLNDYGCMALDYSGSHGVATSIGHASLPAVISPERGSVLSVAEALTNIIWAPLKSGLSSVVLSANWMWSPKNKGEAARLYSAVDALSSFCVKLGIAVPTGKDSLSMTMQYPDGEIIQAPGTVIVSAAAECSDIRKCVTADLKLVDETVLVHIDFTSLAANPLGGSSFAQTLGQLGSASPYVSDIQRFKIAFNYVQDLIFEGKILAGHDISSGGLITSMCEMAFAGDRGLDIRIAGASDNIISSLFSEKPGVVFQVTKEDAVEIIQKGRSLGLRSQIVADIGGTQIKFHAGTLSFQKEVSELRRVWFKPSFLLDEKQTTKRLAKERYEKFDAHPLRFSFPKGFSGKAVDYNVSPLRFENTGVQAAIVREKGTNGDREMALSLFAAGFNVKDVAMKDLIEGREDLSDISFIVFPGGFSNSDVLGAGRGWAGVFRYHETVMDILKRFFQRKDTLSLGVCNGCQLIVELGLLFPNEDKGVKMRHNESGKFESAFVSVRVEDTASVMLKPLIGSQLGIWVAHGEGRFSLPEGSKHDIPLKYVSVDYPANPNGSDFNAAGICSPDGRHLAMMPHLERSIFSWQYPYWDKSLGLDKSQCEITPWLLAFKAAKDWIVQRKK